MKRIFLLLAVAISLGPIQAARAQDPAVVERLNQLSGKIEDLIAGQETQRKRLESLSHEIDNLREQQQNMPKPNYASPEDLKRVAKAIEEVDRKRMDDFEKIRDEIAKLGKKVTSVPAPRPGPKLDRSDDTAKERDAEKKGYEYVVKQGDTLSLIAQAYSKELNSKITVDQIIAANPGLKPERMASGKKIFIPAPK